jgi:ferrous iron transport protein A
MSVSDPPSREPVFSDGAVTTLDTIKPPARCRIVAVPARGPFRQRLLAMGIIPGAGIEVVRAAPMGDPIEYLVKGYHLSLRKDEARNITVTYERE